ncbi:hypothetical protein WUBG_15744, partial [Wuchereria bancrofti]
QQIISRHYARYVVTNRVAFIMELQPVKDVRGFSGAVFKNKWNIDVCETENVTYTV